MANTEATIINSYKSSLAKQGKTGRKKGRGITPSIMERVEEAAKSEAIISKLFAEKGTKKK